MSYIIKTRTNGMKFVEFTGLDGQRKRLSLGTRNEKEAQELGRAKWIAHLKGEDTKPAAKPAPVARTFTLGMAIDKLKADEWSPDVCKSWPSIWSDAAILLREIGDVEVSDITYETILGYVTSARADGHAPGTIKKRLSRLSKIMQNCSRRWINPETRLPYLTTVPAFPNPGKANVRSAELTELQEQAVYRECDKLRESSTRGHQWWLFKQFIMWQVDTGMRKGETLLIGADRIKDNAVHLYDGDTKNDEGRPIPLTTRLKGMVQTFEQMGITGPFFGGLTFGKIQEMWNEVRQNCGIPDVTIHDLRHTRGQRLADAGVPLEVISELLGHKDISVTARVYTVRKLGTLQKWTEFAEANPGAGLKLVS